MKIIKLNSSIETLIIIKRFVDDLFELRDAKGFRLATYKTAQEAETWAKENGYRTRRDFKE